MYNSVSLVSQCTMMFHWCHNIQYCYTSVTVSMYNTVSLVSQCTIVSQWCHNVQHCFTGVTMYNTVSLVSSQCTINTGMLDHKYHIVTLVCNCAQFCDLPSSVTMLVIVCEKLQQPRLVKCQINPFKPIRLPK